jgi:competence protein ComEC
MSPRWMMGAVAAVYASLSPAFAQEAYVRVVDVGPGLCVIAHTPDGYDLLYDAGFSGSHCADAVEAIVTDNHIELVILSHSDEDHIGELADIIDPAANTVDTIIHTGSVRDTDVYRQARTAIGHAAAAGATVINLRNTPDDDGDGISDEIGSVYELGDEATVTIIAGWSEWDIDLSDTGRLPNPAERLNAISIVVRYQYRGRSVLLTGDTIGRRIGDDAGVCRDAERWMIRQGAPSIRSDVLVAPHHGADNGSCRGFLAAVDPDYVIYSAGHRHRHPRQTAAQRARTQGVPWAQMFRTDLRDDERDPNHNEPHEREWARGRTSGNVDPPGDNNVEICLGASTRVRYRDTGTWCGQPGASP